MTEDERNLLAAAAADPDDDLPRHVYADWCEENGRPERAEFIRLRCKQAAMDWWDGDEPALDRAARRLLRGHNEEWLDHEVPAAIRQLNEVEERGLYRPFWIYNALADAAIESATDSPGGLNVEMLRADQREFPDIRGRRRGYRPPAVFTRLSLHDHFRGLGRLPDLGDLLAHPCWGRLAELYIDDRKVLTRSQAESLADAEPLRRLARLDFGAIRFDRGAASRLFVGHEFPRLTRLTFEGVDGPPGMFATLSDARMPRLRELHLGRPNVPLTEREARSFAGWPAMRTVERLSVGPFADGALDALIDHLNAPRLRRLQLEFAPGETIARMPSGLGRLSSLAELSLRSGQFTGRDLSDLYGVLGCWSGLSLNSAVVNLSWPRELAAHPAAANLRGLDVGTQSNAVRIADLASGPYLKNLESIIVSPSRSDRNWGRDLALSDWPLRRLTPVTFEFTGLDLVEQIAEFASALGSPGCAN